MPRDGVFHEAQDRPVPQEKMAKRHRNFTDAASSTPQAVRCTRRRFLGMSMGAVAALGAAQWAYAQPRVLMVCGEPERARAIAAQVRSHWSGAIDIASTTRPVAPAVARQDVAGVILTGDNPSHALTQILVSAGKPVYSEQPLIGPDFVAWDSKGLVTCEPGWLPACVFDAAQSALDHIGALHHIHVEVPEHEAEKAAAALGSFSGLDCSGGVTALGKRGDMVLTISGADQCRAVMRVRAAAPPAIWLRGRRGALWLTPKGVWRKARGSSGWTRLITEEGPSQRLGQWLSLAEAGAKPEPRIGSSTASPQAGLAASVRVAARRLENAPA